MSFVIFSSSLCFDDLMYLVEEDVKNNFICNECGYATKTLTDLQLHLQRKTAWSNTSLVGCRVNCLIDHKEWHEGIVLQYHYKSGKHFVEFMSQKRWMYMKKIAFYIVERPLTMSSNSPSKQQNANNGVNSNTNTEGPGDGTHISDTEYKDDQDENNVIQNLAPVEVILTCLKHK